MDSPCSKSSIRLDEIDKVMPDAALLGKGNLRGADVEVAVDLRGVADEDFAAKFRSKLDSERGFSGSSRTEE